MFLFLFLALLLALALPAATTASHAEDDDLWATINICDTETNPNVLGVRASMPGNGTSQRMWVRFFASYYDRATEEWYDVEGDSRSPWIKLGNARWRARQVGRTFNINPPVPTTSHVVRGVVKYRWRRKKNNKIVRRARQVTRANHPTGHHGDPHGYSAGLCEITYP